MKRFNQSSIIFLSFLLCGLLGPLFAFAATTPSLGAAATYGVLASTYTNTTAGTTINGDVGFTTGPTVVPAGIHTNYGSGAPYATAGIDQGNALASLNLETCDFDFPTGAVDISTDTTHGPIGVYTPGVYCGDAAMNVGGPLTLNGAGTYIFRAGGALTSTAGATVTLAGGASPCDIFWTPISATTLAANTTFEGVVISDAGITVGANTTWTGMALAFGGTVTTDTTLITVPVCNMATLNVVKVVVNDDAGVSVPSDFNLHVTLAGVDVAGSPATGVIAPGTSYTLAAGVYVVSEDANAAYTRTFSGDCDATGNVTLLAGDNKTCTITNDDVVVPPPIATINVVKTVINDHGRSKTLVDFPLFVNGVSVVSGVTNTFPSPAAYVVSETADVNYTQSFSGDCDASGNVSLVPGDNKFCIITNNDNPIPSSGGGGVYVAPIPPLIAVVKVPSPLSLPAGPGLVNYTYTLTNIGTEVVENLSMTGDTCRPIILASGDTNNDAHLDLNETWVYTCSTTLTETHTNNVVATGWANGMVVHDIASATVLVGVPLVPPLIHITKVPSSLALPAGGGFVTYTKRVTNPGIVALSNVRVTDDKCSPLIYISGDSNNDLKLDTTETWTYTCRTNLTQTTTNTAIATGEANGFTVRDFALATVVVAPTVAVVVPTLPDTGINGATYIYAIVFAVLFIVVLSSLFVVLRKNKV